MKTTRIEPQKCIRCGYNMDATSGVYGDYTPSAGDASVCLGCGNLAVFDENLRLREPTKEEKLVMSQDERITRAQITRAHVVGDRLR